MRRFLYTFWAVAVVLSVVVFGWSKASEAALDGKVIVQVSVWDRYKDPLENAKVDVDRYTSSYMVYGTCQAGVRCVNIYMSDLPSSWTAYSTWDGQGNGTIQVNRNSSTLANGTYYVRRNTFAHELGHVFGINHSFTNHDASGHNIYCTSVMYANVKCSNGSYKPYDFTSAEEGKLGQW